MVIVITEDGAFGTGSIVHNWTAISDWFLFEFNPVSL